MKTYKITRGNKQYVIKAKDTYSAVAKLQTFLKDSKPIEDDRLSPMTYKKLKEMGYNSDKWKNLTQEEANKIVAKSETSSKPKTETPKQETKQPKNNSSAVKSELGNTISPELVKKYPNLNKDLGNLASANRAVRSLYNSNNVEDRERGYALSNKIAAYLDKHYPDTLGDDLGADSLLDTIGDEDRFEEAFLDILENGRPEAAPEETESTQPEEGPSKELQKLLTHKPTGNVEAAVRNAQALWNQINKDIAKRGSNIVKAGDGSDYIFDITDGSRYSKAYKAALAGAPVSVDGYEARIENFTPDEYLRQCARQKGQPVEQLIEDYKDKNYTNLVKELSKSKTINNSIWLDRSLNQQEGIHRAMALKKLGVKTIPTLVVSNKRVPYNQSDKYLSFNK